MNKIIVVVAKGKGHDGSSPDSFIVKLFDTEYEAKNFIDSVIDLEAKYWTYAEIVQDGKEFEPSCGVFY